MTFFWLWPMATSVEKDLLAIRAETLLQATNAWDGSSYGAYPAGQPQITVLRIIIPAHATMNWHTHPMPSVGYILVGELTIEKQDGSAKQHFTAGQALPETIDTMHRGITGDGPVELIVFYAGTVGVPLSKDRIENAAPGPAQSATNQIVTCPHSSSTFGSAGRSAGWGLCE